MIPSFGPIRHSSSFSRIRSAPRGYDDWIIPIPVSRCARDRDIHLVRIFPVARARRRCRRHLLLPIPSVFLEDRRVAIGPRTRETPPLTPAANQWIAYVSLLRVLVIRVVCNSSGEKCFVNNRLARLITARASIWECSAMLRSSDRRTGRLKHALAKQSEWNYGFFVCRIATLLVVLSNPRWSMRRAA